ncbi:MAG: hypothetical protein JWN34_3956 [Bryobacterales bacterium]|jgi:hypothetical protein|nr:hypothetical protein [Bryobacterales bacterium]
MISELQLIANQLNALKSTGPRTEPGKNAAKFNARRHGLTGQFYCMSEGDEAAYKAFEANLLSNLKPATHYESQIAISIVQDQWRLNRSRGTEFNVYGQGHNYYADENNEVSPNIQAAHTMASTALEEQRYFANIALYETRLHRMIARNEKRLAELQAERKAAEAAALEEAELLTRLALMKGEKLNPEATIETNGFVFSTAGILKAINHRDQLAEARHYQRERWDAKKAFPGPRSPLPKAA